MFFGTACTLIERISSSKTEAKREAILYLNSTWLITSELANQRVRKVLFTCVVYTNTSANNIQVNQSERAKSNITLCRIHLSQTVPSLS